MNAKKFIYPVLLSGLGSFFGILAFVYFYSPKKEVVSITEGRPIPGQFVSQNESSYGMVDLTVAAEKSVHSVVHVKIKVKNSMSGQSLQNPLFNFFFGPQLVPQQPDESPQIVGSGSGVIISSDGYIVTNNHVIDGADELEVTLNDNRTYKAKLIGTDPSTDIALLKIDEKSLPALSFGNSDALKVGEWVLAVGNPFNLTSTVTAGIVSAKSRSINIITNGSQPMGIESFIQTDAAVNPGNSGGALVNVNGELIGINTAIASKTGSYTGYSFAIPSSIAQKVVRDLKEFGLVQRALLGVQVRNITSELAAKMNIDKMEGVYVDGVVEKSAASEAGIQKGDIILKIEGELVNSAPEMQEKIGKHSPGDKITIIIKRGDELKQIPVLLRNVNGTSSIVKADELNSLLGASFRKPTNAEMQNLGINNGIFVASLNDGKFKKSGLQQGFIIVKANRVLIESVDDLRNVINSGEEGLFLTGVYPNGQIAYYAINLAD